MTHYQEVVARQVADEKAQLAADVAEVMNTPGGRRLFMRILVSGGVFDLSREGQNRDYTAGRRDAALQIMNSINRHAIDNALLAQIESTKESERLERERQSATTQDILDKKGK
jgi:hypothetical protein